LHLFLVTSPAAAAAVRRYCPRAPIAVVPAPVRGGFHEAPSQPDARAALGIDPDAPCALVMGGGWGLGPLAETAEALAQRGVVVLAVAGHNAPLARALGEVSRRQPRVVPYGFTDQVPTLMAAADLVLTTPGATTCSEARAVGRPLMLLDVMPGHGRDNVQHELELGHADVCDPEPGRLVECVVGALERAAPAGAIRPPPDRFARELADALAMVGILPSEPVRHPGPEGPVSSPAPEEVH
jgi:processive 1,2-diacylglycerol beta-glucosyltransferase